MSATQFRPGDRVRAKYTRNEYRIEFGPYGDPGTYAVIAENGQGTALGGHYLEPIPPADPRVRIAARAAWEHEYENGTVDVEFESINEDYESTARAVLAALDAAKEN